MHTKSTQNKSRSKIVSKSKKKSENQKMFNSIAKHYDFLNHFLSLGMDFYWRRKAAKQLSNNPKNILDVATGTADFAVELSKLKDVTIIGVDTSEKMLKIGKKKIEQKKLNGIISLEKGDAEELRFQNNYFDAISVGFGVRNFENLEKGLSEIFRILKKKGEIIILEPSEPDNFVLKNMYKIYFHHILPFVGKLISKNKYAYIYLPESVKNFPSQQEFIRKLETVGFRNCKHIPLTFGIVSLYTAIKES